MSSEEGLGGADMLNEAVVNEESAVLDDVDRLRAERAEASMDDQY